MKPRKSISNLEVAIDQFEQSWLPNKSVAQYVESHDIKDVDLVRELVLIDIELRWNSGNQVNVEFYLEHFPNLALSSDSVIELVAAEIGLSRRAHVPCTLTGLQQRFPKLSERIEEAFHVSNPDALVYANASLNVEAVVSEIGKEVGDLERTERYRLRHQIGEGGIGKIWLAFDKQLKRNVAVKEIKADSSNQSEQTSRFLREIQLTGILEHPGIIPIYDTGLLQDGTPFYAMRYVEGMSLRKMVADYHQLQSSRLTDAVNDVGLRILLNHFQDVCNAVHFAHEKGIVHRDIKPDNVMIGEFGETLLIDWGLAKRFFRQQDSAAPIKLSTEKGNENKQENSIQTRAGATLGSPAYMSPEMARGEDASYPSSDIYSLGATLYTILTNQIPREGSSVTEVLKQVGQSDPVHFSLPSKRIPPALQAICNKAMSPEPGSRYNSAKQMVEEIDCFLADQRVNAYSESAFERFGRWQRHHRGWISAMLILMTLTAAGATFAATAISSQKSKAEQEREKAIQANTHLLALNQLTSQLVERFSPDTNVNSKLFQAKSRAIADAVMTSAIPGRFKMQFLHNLAKLFDVFDQKKLAKKYAHQAVEAGLSDPDTEPDQLLLARSLRLLTRIKLKNEDVKLDELLMLEAENAQQFGFGSKSHIDIAKNTGAFLLTRGKTSEALTKLRGLVRLASEKSGDKSLIANQVRMELAKVLRRRGQTKSAIKLYQEILSSNNHDKQVQPTDRFQMMVRQNLSVAMIEQAVGQRKKVLAETIEIIEHLIRDRSRILGPNHDSTLSSYATLIQAYYTNEDFQKALTTAEKAKQLVTDTTSRNCTSAIYNNLAAILSHFGDHVKAEEILREALTKTPPSDEDRKYETIIHNLATVLYKLNRFDESLILAKQAFEIRKRILKDYPNHRDLIGTAQIVALNQIQLGRIDDAQKIADTYPLILKTEDKSAAKILNKLLNAGTDTE